MEAKAMRVEGLLRVADAGSKQNRGAFKRPCTKDNLPRGARALNLAGDFVLDTYGALFLKKDAMHPSVLDQCHLETPARRRKEAPSGAVTHPTTLGQLSPT